MERSKPNKTIQKKIKTKPNKPKKTIKKHTPHTPQGVTQFFLNLEQLFLLFFCVFV